jgi:hypothetical protein
MNPHNSTVGMQTSIDQDNMLENMLTNRKKKPRPWGIDLPRGLTRKIEVFLFRRIEKRPRTLAIQDVPLTAKAHLRMRITLQPPVDQAFPVK